MRSDAYVSLVLARVHLLAALYAAAFGDLRARLDVAPLARALGFDDVSMGETVRALIELGALSEDAASGRVSVTARGARALERLAAVPVVRLVPRRPSPMPTVRAPRRRR